MKNKQNAIKFAMKMGREVTSRARSIKITTWLGTGLAAGIGVGVLNATFSIISYNQLDNKMREQNETIKSQFDEHRTHLKRYLKKNKDIIKKRLDEVNKCLKKGKDECLVKVEESDESE